MWRNRFVWAAAALLAAAGSSGRGPARAGTPAGAEGQAAPPASTAADKMGRRRNLLVEYYLRVYGQALEHYDWVTRAMAVISLARIDDPRVTDVLLEVMRQPYSRARILAKRRARLAAEREAKGQPRKKLTRDQAVAVMAGIGRSPKAGAGEPPALWQIGNKVVQVIAWEALHARTRSLTAAQRKQWIDGTIALARRGEFHGSMRSSMLRLLAPQGATKLNQGVFASLFANTNALDPRDAQTLQAMREVLGRWKSPRLIKALIMAMGRSADDGPRADWLLRGLDADVPAPNVLLEKGNGWDDLWKRMQQAWAAWYRRRQPADAASPAGEARPYEGTSTLLPAAETVDPKDDKWRRDLELPRLHLDQLDVCFVVDSTGSMKEVVNWIQRDVRKMLKACALLSREPRIGVVFYRDRGDEYVTQVHALTGDGRALTRAIDNVTARGGGDVPEAVLDALVAALRKQRWSRGPRAVRVVVLVGDAPPHDKDVARVEKLVKAAAGKGFRFHCLKARTRHGSEDLSVFDRIAEWGGGRSVWADFQAAGGKDLYKGSASLRVAVAGGGWNEDERGRPDRVILRAVLGSILTEAYRDRVLAFINVLLEYLETPVKEKRLRVATREERERRRDRHPGGGKRGKHKPPKGPQDR